MIQRFAAVLLLFTVVVLCTDVSFAEVQITEFAVCTSGAYQLTPAVYENIVV